MSLAAMLQSAIERRAEAARERGHRFTLLELASETGIERTTLGRIVKGELRGKVETLHALAVHLELDPGDVLRAAAEWRPDIDSSAA